MRFSASTTLALAAAASAQTFTDCDPTKKTCPKDVGLPVNSFSSNFKDGESASASWSLAAYSTINYGQSGAEFSIANDKQAPTMETDFNVFFGRIDIKMKASKGQGIISSIVLESADLDEVDFEFIGGDNAQVQSNFYGKGNTTTYDRVVYHQVATPSDLFHTYSIDWTAERLQFLIDGVLVRTVPYGDATANYGKNYPQTPSKLKLGSWCGGCSKSEGTVQWAGGKATFNGDPWVMYVDSVNIKNYNPADSYEWTDRSGSWESIRIINDGSASQPSGGSNGGASATGSTSVPTASHSVGNIHISHTPTFTQTGMPYSTNHASVSAQDSGRPTGTYGAGNGSGSEGGASSEGGSGGSGNNGGHGGSGSGSSEDCTTGTVGSGSMPTGGSGSGGSAASTFTSVAVVDPTQAPGSYPSGTGGMPGTGSNGTVSSPVPSGPAQQTGNAASTLTVASGSLFGMIFGLLFV